MNGNYDLIVIGSGTAGKTAAYKCRESGWRVAVIDSRPFGGTCALRGCDPKKVLVGAAEIVDRSIGLEGNGISTVPRISWKELVDFKRSFTEENSKHTVEGFKKNEIDIFQSAARFTGMNTVQIEEKILTADNILIASGSKPRKLGIAGEEYLTLSDEFLDMDSIPESITFIGGGYISFEFAHVAARSGSKVRIINNNDRPLGIFDRDLVKMLIESYREYGIEVELNMLVTAVEKENGSLIAYAGDNGKSRFESKLIVHGAGRIPDIDGLDLDRGRIDRDNKGIIINEYLQSVSNPAVFIAGDANSRGIPLTPVASMEGDVAASNMLEGNKSKPEYTAVPSVMFAYPPLASVGISENEAKDEGLHFEVNYLDTSSWYTSRRIGLEHSASKVIIDKDTGEILGAHILGYNADEVINLFAMAIKFNVIASELKSMIMSYPTASYDIRYLL